MTHVELGVALGLGLEVGINLSQAASAGRESPSGDHGGHGEGFLWWLSGKSSGWLAAIWAGFVKVR